MLGISMLRMLFMVINTDGHAKAKTLVEERLYQLQYYANFEESNIINQFEKFGSFQSYASSHRFL